MAKYKPNQSRLARYETKRTYRRLFFTIFGTIFIVVAVFFLGIPAMIKVSVFIGDLKTSSQPIIAQDDQTPLLKPRIESLPDATKDQKLTISGFAQVGKEVEVFLNDESAGKTTVGADGKFLLSNLTLKEGENTIRAQVIEADKTSEFSQTVFITYKKTAPKLEITKPEEGATYRGEDRTIRLEGQTDPETTVTVSDRWAIVASNGSFYATYTLSDGENILKVKAVDAAGNETTMERKVTYSP